MVEMPTIIAFFKVYGYLAVFGVLILCGLGLPVPEDISLVSGGIISGLGYTNVHLMLLVSLAGVLMGDSIIYALGSMLGKRYIERKHPRFVNRELYKKIIGWFEKHGKITIFAARFMPGLRAPIFFTTGMTAIVPFRIFILIDGVAALVSVPVWIYLGYFGAKEIPWVHQVVNMSEYGILILFASLVVVWTLVWAVKKLIMKSHSRRFDGKDTPCESE